MKRAIVKIRRLLAPTTLLMCLAGTAAAAVPGITGPIFNLTAQPAFINQPDGQAVYSWGYGCNGTPAGSLPAALAPVPCPTMQVPGPTLIVHEGDSVTVKLLNGLPNAAGNTSILFPGFQLKPTCPNTAAAPQGLLACEAAPGGTVTYTFTASAPGALAYYSWMQGRLHGAMGLYW